MADFTRTTISQNAKREYTTPITSLADFLQVCADFFDDTTTGTKTTTSESLKAKIVYFNVAGDEAGSVTLVAETQTSYEDGIALLLGTEAAETIAGTGASGSEDEDHTWAKKYSVSYAVSSEVTDSFTVTIGNKYMLITGYSYEASLTALENWADSKSVLA